MGVIDTILLVQDWITYYAVQPLLILFIGVFIGKLLEETLSFVFTEFKRTEDRYSVGANATKWVVYIAAVCVALYSIGLLRIVLWFLAGVIATLLVLRAVLGMKDFFPNFLRYHKVKAKYKPGSPLKTSFGEGKVVHVHLLDVHVKMGDDDVFIPHSALRTFTKA